MRLRLSGFNVGLELRRLILRLRLPRHCAYDDTFFWSEECPDNEFHMYIDRQSNVVTLSQKIVNEL